MLKPVDCQSKSELQLFGLFLTKHPYIVKRSLSIFPAMCSLDIYDLYDCNPLKHHAAAGLRYL